MNYKKLIPDQKTRFRILRALSFIPDNIMLNIQYYIKTGNKLNLSNPKRFTEWLQWYKINYRNPLLHKCVDKYEVRNYVKEKGLEHILNNIIGVFDDANEIELSILPEKFVAKTTDGGGGENVFICLDKNELDVHAFRAKLNSWRNMKNINAGREWAYTGIKKSRIIIEDYIENDVNPEAGIEDYKILCFNGVPRNIIYDCDRYTNHKRNIYTTNWQRIYVDSDCKQKDAAIPKPDNLQEMLDVARTLSSDFPFVRVDLYDVKGKIIFGELTFYPWSGYVSFNPDSFDYDLGKEFSKAIK